MKKLLGAALVLAVCGTAFAAEGEMDSRFSPAFDAEVSLVKERFSRTDLENKVHMWIPGKEDGGSFLPFDIKGGVKIRILDNLFLTPYVQYKNTAIDKDTNEQWKPTFGIGTSLAVEDVIPGLGLGLDAAYLVKHTSSNTIWLGMKIMPEVTYDFSNSLLLVTVFDDFNFFDDHANKSKKEVVNQTINNELNAEVVFNVFNLMKPGINSGLYTNFVLTTEIEKAKGTDGWKAKETNTMEFGLGLITNPVDWFQAKTGFVGSHKKEINAKTSPTSEETGRTAGWMIGVETKYKDFTFNADYTLFGSEVNGKEAKDTLYHKVNMSVKYSF
ncbi:MAG: hypothetical protein ACTTKL_10590 [Treponema sp.]